VLAYLVAGAAALLFATQAIAAFVVPPGPHRPKSADECIASYEPTFREHYIARQTCSKPCNRLFLDGGRGWEQRYNSCYRACGATMNEQFEEIMRARKACFERAKSAEDIDRSQLAEGMALGREMLERAEDLHSAVTEPSVFFAKKVDDALRRKLFGETAEAKRTTIENEVFRYLVIQSKYGLAAAERVHGNEVILAIQQDALDRTVALWEDGFKQMEAAFEQVSAMSVESERSYVSTGSAFSPSLIKKYSAALNRATRGRGSGGVGVVSSECAVFDDTQRSSELMMSNPAQWTALLRRCKR